MVQIPGEQLNPECSSLTNVSCALPHLSMRAAQSRLLCPLRLSCRLSKPAALLAKSFSMCTRHIPKLSALLLFPSGIVTAGKHGKNTKAVWALRVVALPFSQYRLVMSIFGCAVPQSLVTVY